MNDLINGLLETGGGLFILFSIVKLAQDKLVKGVSWLHVSFFTAWGYWNIYFYWALDLPYSWWGGILVTAMNTVWLAQLLYYRHREEVKFKEIIQEAVNLMHIERNEMMVELERNVVSTWDDLVERQRKEDP